MAGWNNERLVAHELAHQWFGNSLTAATWADIWLHEGFACYSEWLWSEASGGRSADELAREHHRKLAALPQDLLLGDPGRDDMFDDRVYKRGALTLHALRALLGDRFFDMLHYELDGREPVGRGHDSGVRRLRPAVHKGRRGGPDRALGLRLSRCRR